MKRSNKTIVSLAGLVVLVAIVTAFVFLGAGPAAAPDSAQAAATPAAAFVGESSSAQGIEVIASADFAVSYTSHQQLAEGADLVVLGQVAGVSYLDFNSSAYTKVTLVVSKCFKGDVKPGAKLTILEVGGITNMAVIKGDKFGEPTAEDAATKVKVLLDGAPLTEKGDECLYFLGAGDIGVVDGTYYVPMGAFQGRFTVDNGVAKRFVPADWKSERYTSLAVEYDSIDETLAGAVAE